MRPSILNPLFANAANLPGVGPKTAKLLDRLLTDGARPARVVDLLFHLPTAAIDRRNRPKIADAPLDTIVTLEVRVAQHQAPGPRSKAPYKVLGRGRNGRCAPRLLSRQSWLDRKKPAARRHPLDFRKTRTLGGASPNGASRPRARRRRFCQNGAGRASLSFDGGALSEDTQQGGRRRARQNPRLAGVA